MYTVKPLLLRENTYTDMHNTRIHKCVRFVTQFEIIKWPFSFNQTSKGHGDGKPHAMKSLPSPLTPGDVSATNNKQQQGPGRHDINITAVWFQWNKYKYMCKHAWIFLTSIDITDYFIHAMWKLYPNHNRTLVTKWNLYPGIVRKIIDRMTNWLHAWRLGRRQACDQFFISLCHGDKYWQRIWLSHFTMGKCCPSL